MKSGKTNNMKSMSLVNWGIAVGWAAVLAAGSAAAAEFTGKSFAGANGEITLDEKGRLDFRDNASKIEAGWSGFDPAGKYVCLGGVRNVRRTIDADAKRIRVTGDLPAGEKNAALPLFEELAFAPDGRRVRVTFRIGTPERPAKGFRFYAANSFRNRKLGDAHGREVWADGEKRNANFNPAQRRRFNVDLGESPAEVRLSLAADRTELAFVPVAGRIGVAQNWEKPQETYDRFEVVFGSPENQAEIVYDIDLDLPPSREAAAKGYIVNGFDFGPAGFRLPDFSRSPNLLVNGSFEDGLACWQNRRPNPGTEGDWPEGYAWQIDETTAVHGKRSLRQYVHGGNGNIASFAFPVKPRTKYTVSFWAKTDLDAADAPELVLTGWTQAYGPYVDGGSFGRPTKEWKRYTRVYTTPNRLIQVALGIVNRKKPGHVWFDAVSFTEGETPPDPYVCCDVGVSLETTAPMHTADYGGILGAKLRVRSAAPGKGRVTWKCRDVFRRTLKKGAFDVSLRGGEEPAWREMPELEGFEPGTYAVETRLTGFGEPAVFYSRFAVLVDKSGPFKHRTLLNGVGGDRVIETTERFLTACAKAGMGSVVAFRPPTRKCYERFYRPLGYKIISQILCDGKMPFNWDQEDFLGKWNVARTRPNGLPTVPDSAKPEFVKCGYEMGRKYPYIDWWKTVNEPMYTPEDTRASVKVMGWIAEGLHKADPQAKMLTPDPGAVDESVVEFWNGGGSAYCSNPAVHPYREHPERPDLDADIQMLKTKFSKDTKILFTEGNLFSMFELPENNVMAIGHGKALASSDSCRLHHFTYDIGLGEKASLAHVMRYRLASFKHADFVLVDNDWNFAAPEVPFIGLDMVPSAQLFAINALASLLGDADFRCDILFGEPVRCYLFEDAEKRPVAVIWNYDMNVFTEPQLVSSLVLAGLTEPFELFNMTGAREKAPENGLLPVDGCPLFFRGRPGRLAAFKRQFETLDMVGGAVPDFRIETEVKDAKLNLVVSNLRAKEKSGRLAVKSGDRTLLDLDVSLAPQGKKTLALPLPEQAGRTKAVYTLEFHAPGKEPLFKEFALDLFKARKAPAGFAADGDLAKWADAPAVALSTYRDYPPPAKSKWFGRPLFRKGDADLSANVRAKWSEKGLCLLVEVTDDVYHPDPRENVLASYNGDGLQVYLDVFGDGERNAVRGSYAPDDQAYMIRCRDGKTVEAYREVAPWKQFAFTRPGPEPRITGTFVKTAAGYAFDLFFPVEALPPWNPKAGEAMGISILVNDNDGDYRKRAAQLNAGEEPMGRPGIWPLMVLEEGL